MCPAYRTALALFGIVLGPPTWKARVCSQHNDDSLVYAYLEDVVYASPSGLGELAVKCYLSTRELLALTILRTSSSQLEIFAVVDNVLCTEFLRNVELVVRRGSHDNSGTASKSDLSSETAEKSVNEIQNRIHLLT